MKRPAGLKFTQAQVRLIVALLTANPEPGTYCWKPKAWRADRDKLLEKFATIDRRFPHA